MRMRVKCSGPCYDREIERMIRLFFPVATVAFGDGGAAADVDASGFENALENEFHISVLFCDDQVAAEVRMQPSAPLTKPGGSRERDFSHTRQEIAQSVEADDLRKAGKRAVMYALHETLRDVTGTAQPWGILTGVRPTKLVHAAVKKAGVSALVSQKERLQRDFLIADRRAEMLVEIAGNELVAVPDLYELDRQVSIYIGIPFCPTHCAYCTFPAYSMVEKARYAEGFLSALIKEMRAMGEILSAYQVPVSTVYVGGGTPTSLQANELRALLEAVHCHIPGSGTWRELSVEAGRADTITPDRVAVMRDMGVQRVSVNPQSFRAETLQTIGRGHLPDIVEHRFHVVREAGIPNINMDLILGLPGESVDDVQFSVAQTLRLNPDAITLHTLSLKRSSSFQRERAAYAVAEDDTVRAMMDLASRDVHSAGYHPYYLYRQKDILGNLENVGYSRSGKEGIYNICIIEEAQTIIGLGGGAASKWIRPGNARIVSHQNPREPSAYVETIDRTIATKTVALRAVCESICGGSTGSEA